MSYAVDYPWALAGALGLGIAAMLVVWLEFVRRRARFAKLGPPSTLERLVPADEDLVVCHGGAGTTSADPTTSIPAPCFSSRART